MKFKLFILSFLLPAFIQALPIVTSINPTNGSVAGGTVVQITGRGFTGTTAVNFGTLPAAAFTVNSSISITATAPATFLAGTVDITVTAGSTSSIVSADQYTNVDGSWYAFPSVFGPAEILPIQLTVPPILESPMPTHGGPAFYTAITPDGKLLIAGIMSNTLPVYDLASLQLSPPSPISTAFNTNILSVAIPPGSTTAYLLSSSPPGIQRYNFITHVFSSVLPIADGTVFDMAVTPDGTTAYVSASGVTYPVDLLTNTVGTPISVPQGHIRITPDGTRAFLTNSGGNSSYIDLSTNTPHTTIPTPAGTLSLAINPNGSAVYFLTGGSPSMMAFDAVTLAPLATVFMPAGGLFAIAVTPDGKTAYVIEASSASPSSRLYPINLTDYSLHLPIITPDQGPAIVISPDQAPIASFIFIPNPPGLSVTFDASASISPVGTIVNYLWDFGDSNTLDTAEPVVTHTYTATGEYTVTLTVTNSAGTSTTQTFTGQTVSNNGGPSAQTSQDISIMGLLPPTHVTGVQVENKFLMQEELKNILKWSPPSQGETPVAYKIYKNPGLTILLGTVRAGGKLEFVQNNVHEHPYTYYLVSVGSQGNQSAAVSITVTPRR